jgi:tetratricopeptide (TPR) repeat protein
MKADQPAEALPHFQAAIAADARDKESLFGEGKAELELNRPEAAVKPLRAAIAQDPNYVEAHFVLGTALRALGHSAEALKEQKAAQAIQEKQRSDYAQKLSGR